LLIKSDIQTRRGEFFYALPVPRLQRLQKKNWFSGYEVITAIWWGEVVLPLLFHPGKILRAISLKFFPIKSENI
jgi:hypothetical protein